MKQSIIKGDIKVVGIDLAKSVFHLHAVDGKGRVVLRKKLSRNQLAEYMAQLSCCLVGMEACGGSHDWARKFREMGHDVRLISPQFVKPYVKSNKNDQVDAEAICEAVQRPTMRFVPIKSIEQQDIQSLHRAREIAIGHRTSQINQIRGLMHEYGIAVGKGPSNLRKALPDILQDADNGLTPMFRELLNGLHQELLHLDRRISEYDSYIARLVEQSDACRRVMSIPGIGPLTATALVAAVGDAKAFQNGRQMAAWLGLVPRQHSTGGQPRLLGISKRGDPYLRRLLIHGSRAALRFTSRKHDQRSKWATKLMERKHMNVAAVAMANKNVRTAWALLTRHEMFEITMA